MDEWSLHWLPSPPVNSGAPVPSVLSPAQLRCVLCSSLHAPAWSTPSPSSPVSLLPGSSPSFSRLALYLGNRSLSVLSRDPPCPAPAAPSGCSLVSLPLPSRSNPPDMCTIPAFTSRGRPIHCPSPPSTPHCGFTSVVSFTIFVDFPEALALEGSVYSTL